MNKITSFCTGIFLLLTSLAHAADIFVDFDTPTPPGLSDSLLGTFGGIAWNSVWRWEGPCCGDLTNHVFFDTAGAIQRPFTFSPAPRVLKNVGVFAAAAGTLTLTDDAGQTASLVITVGQVQLLVTGWTRASTTVSVAYTAGQALGITALLHGDPPAAAPPATGSLTASWTAPTTNADGTPLTDLASYRLYVRTATMLVCPPTGAFLSVPTASSTPAVGTTVTQAVSGLPAGVMHFARVTAVDLTGLESACSNEASAVVPAPPPPNPSPGSPTGLTVGP